LGLRVRDFKMKDEFSKLHFRPFNELDALYLAPSGCARAADCCRLPRSGSTPRLSATATLFFRGWADASGFGTGPTILTWRAFGMRADDIADGRNLALLDQSMGASSLEQYLVTSISVLRRGRPVGWFVAGMQPAGADFAVLLTCKAWFRSTKQALTRRWWAGVECRRMTARLDFFCRRRYSETAGAVTPTRLVLGHPDR
jgi:hypothetical protein